MFEYVYSNTCVGTFRGNLLNTFYPKQFNIVFLFLISKKKIQFFVFITFSINIFKILIRS